MTGRRRLSAVEGLLRRGRTAIGRTLLVWLGRDRRVELGRGRLARSIRVIGVDLLSLAEGVVHRIVGHGGERGEEGTGPSFARDRPTTLGLLVRGLRGGSRIAIGGERPKEIDRVADHEAVIDEMWPGEILV